MKKSYLLSLIFISFSLFIFSLALSLFTSCSPGSTTTTAGTTSPPPPAPTPEEVCKIDSGDTSGKCADREDCRDDCDDVYNRAEYNQDCEKLTVLKVGQIKDIHNVLTNGDADDLEEISEKDGEYEIDNLSCYLSISGRPWIKWIKDLDDADDADRDKAQNTLEWIAENNDVADILKSKTGGDEDDAKAGEEGAEIVEELLLKILPDDSTLTVANSSFNITAVALSAATATPNKNSGDTKELWKLKAGELQIGTTASELEEIDLSNNFEKYNALSYTFSGKYNVFSYAQKNSGDDDNQSLFDLAFGMLEEICDDEASNKKATACKRAILCWTASKTKDSADNDADISSEDVWDLAKEHTDALEEDGKSDYSECTAADFAELFD